MGHNIWFWSQSELNKTYDIGYLQVFTDAFNLALMELISQSIYFSPSEYNLMWHCMCSCGQHQLPYNQRDNLFQKGWTLMFGSSPMIQLILGKYRKLWSKWFVKMTSCLLSIFTIFLNLTEDLFLWRNELSQIHGVPQLLSYFTFISLPLERW